MTGHRIPVPRLPLSRAVICLLLVALMLSTAATVVGVSVTVRQQIYSTRQDTIVLDFDRRSLEVFRLLEDSGADTVADYSGKLAEMLPERYAVILPETRSVTGTMDAAAVPEELNADLSDTGTRFLRSGTDQGLMFTVASSRDIATASGRDVVPVTVVASYPMQEQAEQVKSIIISASGIGLLVDLVLTALSVVVGAAMTRPLRRLARAAGDIGKDAPLTPVNTRFRDISEIHRELAESSRRVKETIGELSAKEQQSRQLVGDVAHELRTPLMSLTAALEVALPDADDGTDGDGTCSDGTGGDETCSDETPSGRDIVYRSTSRMTRLVDELLELSRIEFGAAQVTPEDLVVDAVIRESVRAATLRLDIPSDAVTVDDRTEHPVRPVRTDRTRLSRILENVIVNALVHGEPPVHITVRQGADATVTVTVTDSGPGIPTDSRELVFDRFWRGDAARGRYPAASSRHSGGEGNGIGLSIARESAALLGGTLEVTDRPTGVPASYTGATFRLVFGSLR